MSRSNSFGLDFSTMTPMQILLTIIIAYVLFCIIRKVFFPKKSKKSGFGEMMQDEDEEDEDEEDEDEDEDEEDEEEDEEDDGY